ncbi:MAG: hypothetical protein ACQ9ET_04980 [Nitrosomonadaceae bacterium]
MRITKLDCSWDMQQFGPWMAKKYNLEYYRRKDDKDKPAVFFGCYGVGVKQMIINHRALAVIVWSGSDSTRLHEYAEFVQYCKQNAHRVKHIAHSHWIQTDLKHFGLEYIDRVVLPQDLDKFQFHPEPGKMVYHYGSKDRKWYYGTQIMLPLRDKWRSPKNKPEVFITYANGLGQKDLIEVYKNSFIGVRLTEHDNMALSCIEMGLMGRPSIFNGNIPCAIPYMENPYTKYDPLTRKQWVYQDVDEVRATVVRLILEHRENPEPSKELSQEMREFVTDDEKWLNTEFYS